MFIECHIYFVIHPSNSATFHYINFEMLCFGGMAGDNGNSRAIMVKAVFLRY